MIASWVLDTQPLFMVNFINVSLYQEYMVYILILERWLLLHMIACLLELMLDIQLMQN